MHAAASSQLPDILHWKAQPETKENLDYAQLPVIDFSETTTAQGREKLSQQVVEALVHFGCFYIINHGRSLEQMERMYDIADVPFRQLSLEDKQAYATDAHREQSGSMTDGFKFRQYYETEGDVYDEMETYSLHSQVNKMDQPEPLQPFLPEIYEFARHNHFEVAYPLLRLLEIGLKLSENSLVDMHSFSLAAESQVAFLKYYPRSEEEKSASKNVWLSGQTTRDTFSFIYSQPVAALQILQSDGKWRWIKHIENAIFVNTGDTLEILTGGLIKATTHRVFRPAPDQRTLPRLALFYFLVANNDTKLAPLENSSVLQHAETTRRFQVGSEPTVLQYRYGVGIHVQRRKSVLVEDETEMYESTADKQYNGALGHLH